MSRDAGYDGARQRRRDRARPKMRCEYCGRVITRTRVDQRFCQNNNLCKMAMLHERERERLLAGLRAGADDE
jgi:hypothetical protein